jgi:hypothetical protein
MAPVCRCCRVPILTEREFLRACADAGMILINGLPYGAMGEGTAQPAYLELERKRGFQCPTCRLAYCLGCVRRFAPRLPSGGSACPVCAISLESLS